MQYFFNLTLKLKMICLKTYIRSLFFILLILIIGCEGIVKNGQDRLIARAENHYLYISDIKDQLTSFNSNEDSIAIVRGLINNWARKKLIYEKSLINLQENKISQINSMVEDYKSNLYRNSYREFVLKSLMDTILNKKLSIVLISMNLISLNFLLKFLSIFFKSQKKLIFLYLSKHI